MPEMLLCGYSVAICQTTGKAACEVVWAMDGVSSDSSAAAAPAIMMRFRWVIQSRIFRVIIARTPQIACQPHFGSALPQTRYAEVETCRADVLARHARHVRLPSPITAISFAERREYGTLEPCWIASILNRFSSLPSSPR